MKLRLGALIESYIVILMLALVAGVFIPESRIFIAWTTPFLQVIFFLSALKLDVAHLAKQGRDWKLIVLATIFMLIVLPFMVRLILLFLPASIGNIGLAFFLLAAMPSGMTSPLFVELAKGNQALALALTITTSLLAPFTVPFVIQIAYGAQIQVDALGMFRSLGLVVFIPFAVAMLTKRFWPRLPKRIQPTSKPISIILLGLLVAGAISMHADRIRLMLTNDLKGFLLILVSLTLFFSLLYLSGYYFAYWKKPAERNTVAICLTFMNFTLAIYLAARFFPDPSIIITIALAIIPWSILNFFTKRFSH